MKNLFLLCRAALFLMLCVCVEAAPVWQNRIEPALASAAGKNKLVLVVFTGSDWCMPCKFLHDKILTDELFLSFVEEESPALVELDYPQRKKLSPETKKYNEEQLKRFDVSGFPTLLVLRAGTPLPVAKISGLAARSPEKYIEILREEISAGIRFFEKIDAAGRLEGVSRKEKLESLYAEIDAGDEERLDFVEGKILETDPAHALVLKKRALREQLKAQAREIECLMNELDEKFENGVSVEELRNLEISAGEKALSRQDLLPQIRQKYLFMGPLNSAYRENDCEKMKAVLNEIIALDPQSEEGRIADDVLRSLADVPAETVPEN